MSAVLALLAALPYRDAIIDLERPATRASVVLRRLSAVTGQDIRVAPALEDDVLVIRAHNVSAAELMSRIAYASAGRWRIERAIQVLGPSPDLEDAAIRSSSSSSPTASARIPRPSSMTTGSRCDRLTKRPPISGTRSRPNSTL